MEQFLTWAVVILPILFGLSLEIIPEQQRKVRYWRIAVFVFGVFLGWLTWFQISRDRNKADLATKQHIREQATLEGKLDLVADVASKSPCPSEAKIGDIIRQQLAQRRYERARVPISEGRLNTLSENALIDLESQASKRLRQFFDDWYIAQHNRELADYEDVFHEQDPQKKDARFKKHQREHEQIADNYRSQLKALLSDANAIRSELIRKLPTDAQTPDDQEQEAAIIRELNGVGGMSYESCCRKDLDDIADYLDSLASRVQRPKTVRQ